MTKLRYTYQFRIRQSGKFVAGKPTHGKNIIPRMVKGGDRVFAYPFVDENKGDQVYWRDIGTLASYYESNMDLIAPNPIFNLYDDEWPIHRRSQPGPPTKTISHDETRPGMALDSLLSTGTVISGARVERSIVGPRSYLHSWSSVSDSILFDDVEIGRHCKIRRAIIDKHVKIPPHTEIGFDPAKDKQRFTVTPEGIVVIPKGIVLS